MNNEAEHGFYVDFHLLHDKFDLDRLAYLMLNEASICVIHNSATC